MTTPTILLALPGTVTSSVHDVLRDWVALGLLQPFLWVHADDVDAGTAMADVVATHVLGSRAPRVKLQDFLADQRSIESLRLVLVNAVGPELSLVSRASSRALEEPLRSLLPGRVIALQCVLPLHGAGGWEPDLAIPGWQTAVLAPDDAWSPNPTQPSSEFSTTSDKAEYTAHAAAGLAAVAALWTGISTGPFDEDAQGSEPFAVRAYLRRLDSSQVTSSLRIALMDVSRGLPRPDTSQGRCEHLSDSVAAGAQVVAEVRARHHDLFDLELVSPAAVTRHKLDAWAAIKMFFVFLAGVLRRAPGNLVERVASGSAQAISRRTQNALFGADSSYEVVTRGINAAGLPAGARDYEDVAAQVRTRMTAVVPTELATPDVSDLWNSVVNGGLTLADGGERTVGIGPVLIGGGAGVVRDPHHVAPSPDTLFSFPSPVAQRVGTTSVSPFDLLAQDAVDRAMSDAPANDPEVVRTGEQWATWRRHVAASYTGQLGRQLTDDVTQRAAMLKDLLHTLQSRTQEVDAGAVAAEQEKARSLVLRYLLGLLAIVVITTLLARYDLLGRFDLVSDRRLPLFAVVLLVAWTWVHVLAVVRAQRRVFSLLHANRRLEDELDLAARNVTVVANGLSLATTLYQQYLQWAPVLGRFLQQPFGPEQADPPPARLVGLLPRAVGFGVVRPDQERIDAVAHELGTTIFERGWLSPLWQALVDDAPRRLGPSGLSLRDAPLALFADNARREDSLLRRWSALVALHGVERGAGDALWARARSALLAGGTEQLVGSLLTTVDVQAQEAHGIHEPISGREFFTALTSSLSDLDRHYFSPALFTDGAVAQDVHKVARTMVIGDPDVAAFGSSSATQGISWSPPHDPTALGLDQFLVVVQAGHVAPAASFRLRGESAAAETYAGVGPVGDLTALGG